jgi:dTDP-4-amino-4,6-dideoxygalactose transaminase
VNAGEGGILITDDADLVARAVIMSGAYEHNWKKHKGPDGQNDPELAEAFARWQNMLPLYNMRMQNLSAAVIRRSCPRSPAASGMGGPTTTMSRNGSTPPPG